MAGNYDELQAVLRELLTNRFAPKPEYTRGLLGDGQGNVTVPGRPDKNYVRFNRGSTEFFQIFNVTVPAVNDWPVLIGELPWLPGLTQVVGTDWASYEQSGWDDNVGATSPHAPTHEWPDGSPGADPVNVYLRSIVPLRAYSLGTGSTTIYVNSYEYTNTQFSGTVWSGLPGIDLQPVMSSLSTGTARLMGVYLDPAVNQLGVVTGASDIFTDASDPPSPQFPQSVIPVARVRVYGGQANIGEVDIRDARQPFGWIPTGTASAGGGGWPFNAGDGANDAITVHPTDTDADYSSIQSAHDDAAAGATILFSGNFTEDVTISKILTLQGFNPETSVITGSLTVSAAATLRDFKVSEPGTDASNYAITASAAITADNVEAEATGAGSGGNNAGWRITGGSGHRLRSCKGTGSGNDTNNYGLQADTAASDITIEGGEWDGQADGTFEADITSLRTDIDVHLIDAQCKNNTLRITGTLTGSAKDSKGRDAGWIVNNGTAATQMDAGMVGYIDANGDFEITTTEADSVEWVVVTVGNAAVNKPAFVKNRGIYEVKYTGTAPSDGDFLTTSTTAGSAIARSTMHYAIFARCLAAGSGGTVEVLLLTQTKPVRNKGERSAIEIFSHSGTLFSAKINGTPSGTSVVYDTITGNEDSIVPNSTDSIANLVLHNTTQGDVAYIDDVDTGTNTITVTDSADISSWSDNDDIQVNSTTLTTSPGAGLSYFDVKFLSVLNPLTRFIRCEVSIHDSSAAAMWTGISEYRSDAPLSFYQTQVASEEYDYFYTFPLIDSTFCIGSKADGSGTKRDRIFLDIMEVAAP